MGTLTAAAPAAPAAAAAAAAASAAAAVAVAAAAAAVAGPAGRAGCSTGCSRRTTRTRSGPGYPCLQPSKYVILDLPCSRHFQYKQAYQTYTGYTNAIFRMYKGSRSN